MQAYCGEIEITLTRNEFNVFFYLLKNNGKAIKREELLDRIWGYDSTIETRATDDTVKRLRRKLKAVKSIVSIDTVWGYGFRIKVDKNLEQGGEIKHKLLDELFKLGGNYKSSSEIKALEKKFNEYLEKEGEDDQIFYAQRLLKAYVEETTFNGFEEACKLVAPIIASLTHKPYIKWDLYDIRFSQNVVIWTESFEEALKLIKKTLLALKKYLEHDLYNKLECHIYMNLTERLMKADFYEVDAGVEPERSKALEEVFRDHSDTVLILCDNIKDEKAEAYKIMTHIRRAMVLHRDFKAADAYLMDLKNTGPKDLYNAMKRSVAIYSANEKHLMTKRQFITIVGRNLRDRRLFLKQSPEEAGERNGYSESQLNAIERGDSADLSAYKLFQLANNYGMTIEETLNGIKEKEFSNKREEALEALKVATLQLDENVIYALASMANEFLKQEQKIKKQKYLPSDED
ncbi:MAG: winged helix-turn-helix domain-containing protein [Defluviitaleaceae bacterium]|nr:winged helix-turn-helix domain-containing protein [Defluviitaleaceae bacterium]